MIGDIARLYERVRYRQRIEIRENPKKKKNNNNCFLYFAVTLWKQTLVLRSVAVKQKSREIFVGWMCRRWCLNKAHSNVEPCSFFCALNLPHSVKHLWRRRKDLANNPLTTPPRWQPSIRNQRLPGLICFPRALSQPTSCSSKFLCRRVSRPWGPLPPRHPG